MYMKIFVYTNIIGNCCSGDFYFIAVNKEQSFIMANKFARSHNEEVSNNRNYTIEWDYEEVKEHEITPGYLPLNRVTIDAVK